MCEWVQVRGLRDRTMSVDDYVLEKEYADNVAVRRRAGRSLTAPSSC